jgi:hypothetical protein
MKCKRRESECVARAHFKEVCEDYCLPRKTSVGSGYRPRPKTEARYENRPVGTSLGEKTGRLSVASSPQVLHSVPPYLP